MMLGLYEFGKKTAKHHFYNAVEYIHSTRLEANPDFTELI